MRDELQKHMDGKLSNEDGGFTGFIAKHRSALFKLYRTIQVILNVLFVINGNAFNYILLTFI